ncbi:MAG TPA: SbcC/MukB-like Walker B domain-containing protein, partial [Micrococcaceae bacterium]
DHLASLGAELEVLSAGVREAREAATKHSDAAEVAQAQCRTLRTGLEGLQELAGAADGRKKAHVAASELLETIEAYAGARAAATACEEDHLQDHERLLNGRELWLSLVERRLESAAGEMAARLVDGEPCQVCGSAVHPRPSALAGAGLEAAEAEGQAKLARDRAEAAEAESAARLAAARQELAVLQGRGGAADAESARQAEKDAGRALADATRAAAELGRQEAKLAALTARIQEQESLASADREQAAALEAQRSGTQSLVEQLDAKLVVSRSGYGTLGERLVELHRIAELVGQAAAAIQSRDVAAAETATAEAALEAALPRTPFGDAAAARAALLPAAESRALAERIRGFVDSMVRSEAAFEPADVQLAATEAGQGTAAPTEETISVLRAANEAAFEAANAAVVDRELADKALAAVRAAAQKHTALEAEAAPAREHFQRVSAIAETARGRGENNYRMTLNSYVLAARLEQVAVAASQRLGTMSDFRYTLSYSDALAGRNQKSGLGLEVVDQWTGQRRDTATLSGGESFMASLALALGLADVVQQEAGGVDIETLFVDEGFGSLDEQSLEQVMDALEGLRDGGRVVGLVSHVAEMKLRIPTQLQVHKGRTGSTVSVNHAAGVLA